MPTGDLRTVLDCGKNRPHLVHHIIYTIRGLLPVLTTVIGGNALCFMFRFNIIIKPMSLFIIFKYMFMWCQLTQHGLIYLYTYKTTDMGYTNLKPFYFCFPKLIITELNGKYNPIYDAWRTWKNIMNNLVTKTCHLHRNFINILLVRMPPLEVTHSRNDFIDFPYVCAPKKWVKSEKK